MIFADPTFGGECPPLAARKRVSHPAYRYSPEPVVEDLPPEISREVDCMVSHEHSVAGSGTRAAKALRRPSQESKKSKGSGSGFGSESDFEGSDASNKKAKSGGPA